MRPGAGASGIGGEDDEGVGEFKKQIFRKSILFLKAACPNRTAAVGYEDCLADCLEDLWKKSLGDFSRKRLLTG